MALCVAVSNSLLDQDSKTKNEREYYIFFFVFVSIDVSTVCMTLYNQAKEKICRQQYHYDNAHYPDGTQPINLKDELLKLYKEK